MKQIDVLIIDDEEKFAMMLARRLALRNCLCEVCFDGNAGLTWVKDNPYSAALILLDLQLPDMYGTQVLTGIKEINPSLPVIILTGHGSKEDEKECMALGAHEFVNKPMRIDDIIERLNQLKKEA